MKKSLLVIGEKKMVKGKSKSTGKFNTKDNAWLIGKILKKNDEYSFEPRGGRNPGWRGD